MKNNKIKIRNPLEDINDIPSDNESIISIDSVDSNNSDKKSTKKVKKTKKSKKEKIKKKAIFKDPFEDMRFEETYDKEEEKRTLEKLPWIEKYRPNDLNEIVSHDSIIDILNKFIKNKSFPHVLFYGPPGTGKTSTITACAKRLYGEYYDLMVLELNASYDRGVETVRDKIKKFINAKNDFFGIKEEKEIFKLVILDETDSMTVDAQAILKQIMEKYMKTVRFCLICNFIHKIEWALRSRCVRFRFSPLAPEQIKKKIKNIVKKENISITKDGIQTLIDRSRGDMRQVFNTLQSINNLKKKKITSDHINDFLGYPNSDIISEIAEHLANSSFNKSIKAIQKFQASSGLSINDIINEIYKLLLESVLKTKRTPFDKYKQDHKSDILIKIAHLQHNYVTTGKSLIQTGTLIGIFSLDKN